jgi:hypothetical protein
LPFFFSFFFLFFFFFLFLSFLSLCFPHFFRPSLEEEEEDEEEEEELEELEEEEEELDRGLLRALCLLLSVMQGEGEASAPRMLLALRPWDPEAEQFLEVSLLLFFLLFSDPRPRDRLRLLERLREPM